MAREHKSFLRSFAGNTRSTHPRPTPPLLLYCLLCLFALPRPTPAPQANSTSFREASSKRRLCSSPLFSCFTASLHLRSTYRAPALLFRAIRAALWALPLRCSIFDCCTVGCPQCLRVCIEVGVPARGEGAEEGVRVAPCGAGQRPIDAATRWIL